MSMAKYGIKRVLMAVLTLFIVATLTFFLMNLIPGGPFMAEKAISEQAMQSLNEKYGLNQPLPVQYKNYITHALQGDFGVSTRQRGRTVTEIIVSKFPVSAKLGGISLLVSLCVGIPLGAIAALNRGKWADKLIIFFATCGIAVPSFILCTLLLYFFGVINPIFPTVGLSGPASYVLPVISLAFYPSSYITRLMRSSMLDVLGQDYMRTARAKGLPQWIRLFKHALRNAILPVVTYIGPMLAYTLTGSFVVEKIFTIPGLGKEFIGSILGRDYPLVMGTTIFLAALLISMNVIVDLAYKLIDPRINLE